jgi:hypothetical protein
MRFDTHGYPPTREAAMRALAKSRGGSEAQGAGAFGLLREAAELADRAAGRGGARRDGQAVMNLDDLIRRLESGETSLAFDQEISRALGFGGGSVVPPYSRPGLFFRETLRRLRAKQDAAVN